MKKINTENLVREFLLDEGILREKIPDPDSNLDFGYMFAFPPGREKQNMNVFKLKNKRFITISLITQISKSEIETLNSLKNERKSNFFWELRKFFLIKEVYFQIDVQNYRYEIKEQIFLKLDGSISKNSFFKTVRKIFFCHFYSNILLEEFCERKKIISKKGITSFDFSLYT